MKSIKVKFVDLECWNIQELVHELLKDKYILDISDNPDFVFWSCYGGNQHINYTNAIKIEFIGEPIDIDFNTTDYAISMDINSYNGKNCYCPLWILNSLEKKQNGRYINFPNKINYNKSKLYSTIIRNTGYFGNGFDRFTQINQLSNMLNSIENLSGKIGNTYNDKYNSLLPYKFNFCFENTYKEGYTTEKIVDAFDAGCIPIYKGDPLISTIFNEKSFINCNNKTNEQIINEILTIQNNDSLYNKMLNEQPLNDISYINKKINEVKNFLINIIESNL